MASSQSSFTAATIGLTCSLYRVIKIGLVSLVLDQEHFPARGTLTSDAAKLSIPVQVLQWKRVRNSGHALPRSAMSVEKLCAGSRTESLVILYIVLNEWRLPYAQLAC